MLTASETAVIDAVHFLRGDDVLNCCVLMELIVSVYEDMKNLTFNVPYFIHSALQPNDMLQLVQISVSLSVMLAEFSVVNNSK